MNLQWLQWTTSVTEITWYRKLMPVQKFCLGRLQSWSEGRCEVNIMSRSNTSYWNKLMRVQNGVLENESISSSCQTWCFTTSEWVNNHCYFVSFEHLVSYYLIHIVTDLASSSWGGGNSKFGGISPPKCAWIKHCVHCFVTCMRQTDKLFVCWDVTVRRR